MSCGGEQLDQGRLTARVHRAEREGVTDRDQTLHPERRRAFSDQLERERAELSGLVEVDVDADSVSFGDAEHDVEMGDRITVVGARIETADDVGACPHGGVEQVGGTRVAKNAGLRERDHLHVGPPSVRLPGGQHSLQPLEPTVGVDLDVAPDRRGARGDRGTQRPRRPLADRGPSAAPVRTIVADQRGKAHPGGVRAERQAEARRVEMGVGIGERRQQHTAPAVGDRHTRGRLASGDPAIEDQDVDRATAGLARPRPNVPQQQISHLSNRSVQKRLAQGFGNCPAHGEGPPAVAGGP